MEGNNAAVLVQPEGLRLFAAQLLKRIGIDQESSSCIASSLVEANLRGYDTHGVVRLPTYIKRFTTIEWQPPTVVRDSGATGLVDGHDYMGQVCATMAMNMAISKAREYGVGIVGVRNSNHFGSAAHYGMMAADHNMIGFALTNASPRLAPWGGKQPLLGNNPLSFVFPTNKGYPVALDMSISVVAAGKIRAAAAKGEQIPDGWAADKDGRPTRDPLEALKGLFLPIGGHKGYGLALMVDILSGVLTGSGFANGTRGIDDTDTTQHVGHFLGAIDIERFMPVDEFLSRMDTLIHLVKSSETAPGVVEVFVPGEIEYRTSRERSARGIPLPQQLVDRLNGIAEQLGEPTRLGEDS